MVWRGLATLRAHEQSGVTPDINEPWPSHLGAASPIGAILMSGAVADSLAYGDHGTTFGGGPFITSSGTGCFRYRVHAVVYRTRATGRPAPAPGPVVFAGHRAGTCG